MRREESLQKKSIMISMADRYGMEVGPFESTILKTVMPGGRSGQPSQEQIAAFLMVAYEYELNPFTKEIYAFPAKGGGIVPMVGFDGWMAIAERHPQMDGLDFDYTMGGNEGTQIIAVTAFVYRKDRKMPIKATEWLEECKRPTDPWRDMPNRMLRNKAAGQAVRMAFGVSGIFDRDEANDIATARTPEYAERAPTPGADETKEAIDALEPQEVTAENATSAPASKEALSEDPPSGIDEIEGELSDAFDGFGK